MAREKATIRLDRSQVAEVKRLTGAPTTSAAIDLALRTVVRIERVRADVVAYGGTPQSVEEAALASAPVRWTDLEDDTDWNAVFPVQS